MKQGTVNKAYLSILNLSELKFPYKISREIYKMKNSLKEIVEFGAQEELKIIKGYNGEVRNDGSFAFVGVDKKERTRDCFNDLQKWQENEVDLEIKPILLTEADCDSQKISVSDIENLEGFIIFE